ncbi:hypothetical protein IP76_06635 [Rhizobium sp. AAP43]|nr:hypothetical protein IP76_06635 [Rhizobium sp. AAP43]
MSVTALGFLAVAAIIGSQPSSAQQVDIFRMSGEQLLAGLKGEAVPEITNPDLRRQVSYDRAAAYVAGVADATDGTAWCMEGGILLHELTDRVFTELKTAPADALARNAAIPVLAALTKSFPCKDD